MISAADVELAKALASAGATLVSMAIEWFSTGKRPPPDRVAVAWASVEQVKAKMQTDAAADARWPDKGV